MTATTTAPAKTPVPATTLADRTDPARQQACNTTEAGRELSIDMLDPHETCRQLDIDAELLLTLVNKAVLPAYNLGGSIRFRRDHVGTLRSRIAVAA